MEEKRSFATDFISVMRQNDADPVVPYVGAKVILIGLLFIYAITHRKNLVNAMCQDDNDALFEFMRMFIGGGFDESILGKAFNMVEKNYGLPQGLLELEILKMNLQEHWYVILENFADIRIDPGDDYALTLADLITRPQDDRDEAFTEMNYTNESLQHLVAKILNVKKTDTFVDCCCGMFSSALHNDAANYIGIERNRVMAGIAAMILIMCGKRFEMKIENFVESKNENIADKILADVSYGVQMPKMEDCPYGKNGDAYCIENVVRALKDGGTAVVVCSGSVLTKQDSSKKLRESITRDHLKAVIALPPMSFETKSNTNLIVLEKNCHANEITFINASNLEIVNKKRKTLSDADVSDVFACLEGKNSNCLSKKIKVDDILKSDTISWAPNNYVNAAIKPVGRPVEDIDKDLQCAYKELKKLLVS